MEVVLVGRAEGNVVADAVRKGMTASERAAVQRVGCGRVVCGRHTEVTVVMAGWLRGHVTPKARGTGEEEERQR